MNFIEQFAVNCGSGDSFLGFPTWYAYLKTTSVGGQCAPQVTGLSDIWLIVAALLSVLIRIAALFAVFFIVYGGVQYIMSQGNADATTRARSTIINALLGLLLAITSAAIVQFVAGRFN